MAYIRKIMLSILLLCGLAAKHHGIELWATVMVAVAFLIALWFMRMARGYI